MVEPFLQSSGSSPCGASATTSFYLYCSPNNCSMGSCGTASCWGKSADDTTLFEITIGNKSENDQGEMVQTAWYDISLVDA
ncbi:hypothetical protein F5884DRAFT_904737 [Xylogone sp. PMI_703]|nr:hypothetical protein F5884DRAFT_904737 [Xylogone sp. PMI_703]